MKAGRQAIQLAAAAYGIGLVAVGLFIWFRGATRAQGNEYELGSIGINLAESVLSIGLGVSLILFAVWLDRDRTLPARQVLLSAALERRMALVAAATVAAAGIWLAVRGPLDFMEFEWRSLALLITGGTVAVAWVVAYTLLTSPRPMLAGFAYTVSAVLVVAGQRTLFVAPRLVPGSPFTHFEQIRLSAAGVALLVAGVGLLYAVQLQRAKFRDIVAGQTPEAEGTGAPGTIILIAWLGIVLALIRLLAIGAAAAADAYPLSTIFTSLATVAFHFLVALGTFWFASRVRRRASPEPGPRATTQV